MKHGFKMGRNKGILGKCFKNRFFRLVISVLVIMCGLSLGKLCAEEVPHIDAEINIIRLEEEGFVEIEIGIRGREIEDAELRLEGPYGNTILLKESDNPAQNVDVYLKIEETKLEDILPNGSYKYIIDYGADDLFEVPFEITGDFPQKPSILQPQDGSTVPRNFLVEWRGGFDNETLFPEYWLEFGADGDFRGGSEISLVQVFGLEPNFYKVRGLFGPGMGIEIILTATKTVFIQEGPENWLHVLKSSHIDMDVTTR